ncbi:MAG: hypothetical protein FWE45_01945 [Firmicutes bacterium]|nr:hypothetical protein [Bacillota bacterium]
MKKSLLNNCRWFFVAVIVMFAVTGYALSVSMIFGNHIDASSSNEQIETPTNVRLHGTRVVWDAVDGAIDYRIYVTNIPGYWFNRSDTFIEVVDEIIFTLVVAIDWGIRDFDIRIRAVGSGGELSDWSDMVSFNYQFTYARIQLEQPVLRIDEDNFLRWNTVSLAEGYNVIFNSQTFPLGSNVTEFDLSQFHPVDYGVGSHNIEVVAWSSDTYTDSSSALTSFQIEARQLGDVTGLALNGYILSWDAPITGDVSGFGIYENNNRVDDITQTSIDIRSLNLGTGQFNIGIRALPGPGYTKSGVVDVVVTFLAAPTGLALNNGMLTWNSVQFNDAGTYQIIVNGNPVGSVITGTSFDLNDLDLSAGSHLVRVIAVGGDNYTFNSGWSAVETFIVMGNLAAPEIELEGNRITWGRVANATEYRVIIGGKWFSVAGLYVDLSVIIDYFELGVGMFEITVIAVGNPITHYNSETSNIVSFARSRLFAPNGIAIEDNILSWNGVTGSSGYRVYINDKFHEFVIGTSLDLSNLPIGNHTISILAVAKDVVFNLNSEHSGTGSHTVTPPPIATPDNLEVEGNELTWVSVEGVSGFRIYINDEFHEFVTSTYFDLSGLEIGEYRIRIVAVASNIETHVNSLPSIEITHVVTEVYTPNGPKEKDEDEDGLDWWVYAAITGGGVALFGLGTFGLVMKNRRKSAVEQ